MDKKTLAFNKMNFILLAIGLAIIIIGFVLMSGGSSTDTTFDASIFSATRIKVAPVVTFVGFISIIFAVMYRPKNEEESDNTPNDGKQ